jgi:hypothetical protein
LNLAIERKAAVPHHLLAYADASKLVGPMLGCFVPTDR